MKLNYRKTILTGFAFFLICAFWQAYDNTIPLILTNRFGMSQTWSGVIMALDNILALFMLPLFGAVSDKVHTRYGRRTPFIFFGTIISAAGLVILSFVDMIQLKNISAVTAIDSEKSLETIYESESDKMLLTPDGQKFYLDHVFTKEEFVSVKSQSMDEDGNVITNPEYTSFVVPARQAYVNDITLSHKSVLTVFISVLLVTLVSMSVFRSPAVALMPDVTIKPLRSKANAVINLMGAFGGIIVLVLGIIFSTSSVKNTFMSYIGFFSLIAVLMLLSLTVFILKVKENDWADEMRRESELYGIDNESDKNENTEKLSREKLLSLIFILVSVALWFFGYNAVTSKYSVYASNILHKDYNLTLIIAQAAAIISYLPVGIIASKVGRKKTIIAGVIMLAAAFTGGAFMTSESPTAIMNVIFSLAGIAWATINVNSFPMVVELSSGSNIGKYTGYYYTASMAAQIATPMLSGVLMDHFGMRILFPYAAFFSAFAILTMYFVKHGDSKPTAPKGQLEAISAAGDD